MASLSVWGAPAPHTSDDAFSLVRPHPAEDMLIVETRVVGTHKGPFLGVAPTGRPVDVPMAIFVSFADGLMSGERFYWNPADLMAQVGVEIPFALAA